MGDLKDSLDARIADASLNAADVGAVEIGLFGKFVLGKLRRSRYRATFRPKAASVRSLTGIVCMMRTTMPWRLWTIGYNVSLRNIRCALCVFLHADFIRADRCLSVVKKV